MKTEIITDVPPTLEEAQNFVGGYIEIIYLKDGSQMIVNEEGRLFMLPQNKEASLIAGRCIVGNVLILKGNAKFT